MSGRDGVHEENARKERVAQVKYVLIGIIRGYQIFISPWLPATCRYYPTCSTYFLEALQRYGFFKGSKLGILRILRCHPFHEGGYDPVP